MNKILNWDIKIDGMAFHGKFARGFSGYIFGWWT
jgi:hypothetical protein